jgi:hypothetical protein
MSPADPPSVSIGCGSGFARDRLAPAVDLAASGRVDYLSFDALAERTLAQAHVRRLADPSRGHDPRTRATVAALAPHVAAGLKVVGSFGGANVPRALEETVDGFRALGLTGVKVAAVSGDDVLDLIVEDNPYVDALGLSLSQLGDRLISANCYLGAAPIVEALRAGAQWVIGGRISDASLFAAPICHELGWELDDWDRVAHATLAGHILECSVQATGGYFADPPHRVVPGLHDLGFPIADVNEREVLVTKLPDTGGLVDEHTVGLQVAYEVHDPSAYLTPDVTADFTQVTCTQAAPDEVLVRGARGAPRPASLKVLVGVATGYRAVAEISYAAAGCTDRARLAGEIVDRAIQELRPEIDEIRFDLLGVDALAGSVAARPEPAEVRLRVAARCRGEETARILTEEVERLYVHGPAGGGGVTASVTPSVSVYPLFVDAARVTPAVEVVTT